MTKKPGRQGSDPQRPDIASRSELNKFLSALPKVQKDIDDEEQAKQKEAVQEFLQQTGRAQLQRLIGRAFADALKSPGQKLGRAQAPAAEETKGPAVKKKGGASKKRR